LFLGKSRCRQTQRQDSHEDKPRSHCDSPHFSVAMRQAIGLSCRQQCMGAREKGPMSLSVFHPCSIRGSVLFVAAAGIAGANNDTTASYPSNYQPNPDALIAVAASDRNDFIAGFSDHGAGSVDLAAPGVKVTSTTIGGGHGVSSGTSFATPQVT